MGPTDGLDAVEKIKICCAGDRNPIWGRGARSPWLYLQIFRFVPTHGSKETERVTRKIRYYFVNPECCDTRCWPASQNHLAERWEALRRKTA
jgi:hypothetical protein